MKCLFPEDHTPDTSDLFKELRIRAKLGQKEVAKLIGVTSQTISNKERGRCPISLQDFETLANQTGYEIIISLQRKP